MKMAVLYFTKTGTTRHMAQVIADGMQTVEGVEARTFPLDDIDADYIAECGCVVVGTPTYLASMAADVKVWLDTPTKSAGLAGKIGGAFATADYVHGGAEIAIQSVLSHLMVKGMLAYSGGGAFGKPPIHLGPVAIKANVADYEEVFRLYGQRMATTTKKIFAS